MRTKSFMVLSIDDYLIELDDIGMVEVFEDKCLFLKDFFQCFLGIGIARS